MLTHLKKKKAACTAEDARFLLLLCLGREPFLAAELEIYTDQSLFGALKRILQSPAFSHSLFDPFVLGKSPMQFGLSAAQATILQTGLKRHFGLKVTIKPGDMWLNILTATLSSERMQKAFLTVHGADRLNYLQTQLNSLNDNARKQIFGAVHQSIGRSVRGFAAIEGNSKPLTLDFFLNGQPAGTTTADLISREISEKYQTNGNVAFTHTLEVANAESLTDACLLVFERDTGAMVCPPKNLVLDVQVAAQTMARIAQELNQLRAADKFNDESELAEQLNRLEQRLPSLEQYVQFRLEDYPLYKKIYRTCKAPYQDKLDVSILVTVAAGDTDDAERTHRSIEAQSYRRFTVSEESDTLDISGFDLLIRLNPGELLDAHALGWFAATANSNPSAKIIRAGNDHCDASGNPVDPVFISRFDPLILQQKPKYASCFATRLDADDTGSLWSSPETLWQDIFTQHGEDAFVSIDEILFSLPVPDKDTATQALNLAEPDAAKTLAIIIPTKDRLDILKPCVESLLATIAAKDTTEIIIVDNASTDAATTLWLSEIQSSQPVPVRVMQYNEPFNWSAINNLAAANSDADYFLFLNNDTLAVDKGWDLVLRQLLGLKDAGVIGAKLLYEDNTVQHAGVVLNDNSLAVHEGAGLATADSGYDNRLSLTRQCEAVTGAFLACSRATFQDVGGFDAENFPVTFNDIDFCLKATEANKRVLYSPMITFYHLESISRGYDGANAGKAARAKAEHDTLRGKWAAHMTFDRWYPKRLKAAGHSGDTMIKPPTWDDR